jgi:hypothetical protein
VLRALPGFGVSDMLQDCFERRDHLIGVFDQIALREQRPATTV